MGNVLKGYRYRIVDNRSFDLPLPIKYVLLKEDSEVAEYEILSDEKINCRIITKYKENMITPIYRPLTIADMYYFFSSRVFQDKTPFTQTELGLLGLDRYNVYDIIRKTRGITPYDNYWLRFDGDNCSYDKAKKEWDDVMSNIDAAPKSPAKSESAQNQLSAEDPHISAILNQHKFDFDTKLSEENAKSSAEPAPEPVPAAEPAPSAAANNMMSADEIEALLMKSGLTDIANEPNEDTPDETAVSPANTKMSEDDIAKLLAETAGAVETAVETPAEPAPSSNAKMSEDDIAKLLAETAGAVEEAVAPAEPAPSSNAKMSEDDIAKLLAETAGAVEEAVAPAEPAPSSNAKMSEDDIAKLLAETAGAAETAPAEPALSDEEVARDDIEKMLSAAGETAETSAEVSAPAETSKPSGGKMSQDDIEKMLAAASEAVQEPLINEPDESAQPTLDDIKPAEEPVSAAETSPAEETKPSGGKMSQADIEALLNGMAEDAK